MFRKINLFSLKGGQGVSTTAVLLANSFALNDQSVLLVDREGGDLPALLGITDRMPGTVTQVTDKIHLLSAHAHNGSKIPHGSSDAFDAVIYDLDQFVEGAENFLVTQPCYMALKRASGQDELIKKCAGAIIVRPADRCLTDSDVMNVLGIKRATTITMNATIARASDAGILASSKRESLSIKFPVTV
jgi:hypothetical protein